MKFLIWFGCAFVLSLITVSLKYAGILLGFIPTFILGSLMFWSARTLCKKWDSRKGKNKKTLIDQNANMICSKNDVYILIAALCIPILVCVHIIMECSGFDVGIFYIITDSMAFFVLPVALVILIIKNKSECNMTLNVLSVLSIFAALSSIFLQDSEKCIQEIMNPTIFYVFIIVVNVVLLIGGNLKKIKHIRIIQSFITFLLAIASAFAMYEGSVFSSSTKSWNGIWNFYKNADLVFAIDMFWFVSSFVMCTLTLLPLMTRVPQNILKEYYSSLKYREKCYKKVADMQSYLEKGIITQEEFEKNKSDILKKIKNMKSNNDSKLETSEEKNVVGDIISVQNEELTREKVEIKDLTPIVRDGVFWEKVKTAYSNLYQENGQVFFQSLVKAELLKFNEATKSLELNVFDDEEMQRYSVYGAEFDRFLSYVFKSWMRHKIPEINDNEMLKITEIMSEHFNIDDPYIKEIAPDTINRWSDFDKININEHLYGFYEGSGHKVEVDEKIGEDNREILATYDAMRWIMTDIIYTTSKTSKTFSYDKVVEYLKDNHITWKDSDDRDAALESMKMINIYCNLSDVYLSVIQTVNWIASNEFMN